ncbi:hypothetical protein IW150_002580, partial [Coemansia sp. RSA 2607]
MVSSNTNDPSPLEEIAALLKANKISIMKYKDKKFKVNSARNNSVLRKLKAEYRRLRAAEALLVLHFSPNFPPQYHRPSSLQSITTDYEDEAIHIGFAPEANDAGDNVPEPAVSSNMSDEIDPASIVVSATDDIANYSFSPFYASSGRYEADNNDDIYSINNSAYEMASNTDSTIHNAFKDNSTGSNHSDDSNVDFVSFITDDTDSACSVASGNGNDDDGVDSREPDRTNSFNSSTGTADDAMFTKNDNIGEWV